MNLGYFPEVKRHLVPGGLSLSAQPLIHDKGGILLAHVIERPNTHPGPVAFGNVYVYPEVITAV